MYWIKTFTIFHWRTQCTYLQHWIDMFKIFLWRAQHVYKMVKRNITPTCSNTFQWSLLTVTVGRPRGSIQKVLILSNISYKAHSSFGIRFLILKCSSGCSYFSYQQSSFFVFKSPARQKNWKFLSKSHSRFKFQISNFNTWHNKEIEMITSISPWESSGMARNFFQGAETCVMSFCVHT